MPGPSAVRLDRRRIVQAAGVLALFAAVAVTMHSVVSRQGALGHPDVVDQFLRARACVELGACEGRGPPTSLSSSLHHGALWIRIVGFCLGTGLGVQGLQVLGVTGAALGAVVTYAAARGVRTHRAALFAGFLAIALLAMTLGFGALEMLLAMPLPLAAYFALACLHARSGNALACAGAAFALALAVDLDVSAASLLPVLFVAAVLFSRRPALALAASCTAVIAPLAVVSPLALEEFVRFVPYWLFAAGALGGTAALSVAWKARPRLIGKSSRFRVRFLLDCATSVALTGMILFVLFSRHVPLPHHLAPASVPLAILVSRHAARAGKAGLLVRSAAVAGGLGFLLAPRASILSYVLAGFVLALVAVVRGGFLVQRGLRRDLARPLRAPSLAWSVLLAALPLVAALPGSAVTCSPAQSLALPEAERVALGIYARGYRFPELVEAILGPELDALLLMAVVRAPGAVELPVRSTHQLERTVVSEAPRRAYRDRSLVVVKGPRSDIEGQPDVLFSVPAAGGVVVGVLESKPFLKKSESEACFFESAGTEPVFCRETRPDAAIDYEPPYLSRFGELVRPLPPGWFAEASLRWRVAVRTDGRGEPHVIRALDTWPARFRITRVEGVAFEGSLPAREVRLLDRIAESGHIEFSGSAYRLGTKYVAGGVADPFVEVRAASSRVLDSLRGGEEALCGDLPGSIMFALWRGGIHDRPASLARSAPAFEPSE
ncbi:MAG TPA: hypothetical protein VGK73_31925 [Polyangiaceae bacterium]